MKHCKNVIATVATTTGTIKNASVETVNTVCKFGKNAVENMKKSCIRAKETICLFCVEKKDYISNTVKDFFYGSKYVGFVVVMIMLAVLYAIFEVLLSLSAFLYVHVLIICGLADNMWISGIVVVVMEGLIFLAFLPMVSKMERVKTGIKHTDDSIKEATFLYKFCVFKVFCAIETVVKNPLIYLIKGEAYFFPVTKAVVGTVRNVYGKGIEDDIVKKIEKHSFKTFFKSAKEIRGSK